ncbi:PREDICTED: probable acyl-CoA dehydrogenase IBR3 [Nicotiana attenuata]|uniref:Acyl-coa dehydrogenase ibr3 n=1 Tax=Nicotiana attenuata TaxID=49451 RepID=A0A1J6KLI6_NICAT|nr:PREDICTED: probable acyl-CoA dehydrogenase IBR3 [Nicotiana attenuata]OIT22631.1 putative acyl-coa dehydrogenase ibr3 [Nicotiana attenuata]
MANKTCDLVGRVDPAQSFDTEALLRYASANVVGFPTNPSQFTVSQFGHGQSNPTFLIEVCSGTLAKRYVLRKKPHGTLLASAHAVEREYEVLHALSTHTVVPVPKVFCLCTDSSVIGTPFYMMEYLEGRIFIDPKLPDVQPERRRVIYRAVAQALAVLHSADVDAIGLGHYGKRTDYCKRQVERWAKQYLLSTGEGKSRRNPKMLELADWLRQRIPLEDSSGATAGLVHGDFRIDNVVFHPIEDRVIGILDWELSTLGNQMCDVAYSCLGHIVNIASEDIEENNGFELTSFPEGVPSLANYLADYCSAAGRPWPVDQWKFYIAFSLFRGASIYAGVHSRWIMGNASGGERARRTGERADSFIRTAWSFIQRKSVLPQHPPTETSSEHSPNHGMPMGGRFVPSEKVQKLRQKLIKFMEDHIYPRENEFSELAQSNMRWTIHPDEEKLKELAKKEGLWNLWIPFDSAARARELIYGSRNGLSNNDSDRLLGAGLSNLEYGYLCEIMGRSVWAPQIFNCGAPDTGNMEVLLRYGNEVQMKEWLVPLLEGKIRSGFAMTEPQVASSDATNIECSIKRHGGSYIINGTKWWTSGAMDPRCKILIVMGKTDLAAPKHKQQSMILVDINCPGITVKRPLTVFGFDDAPHGHAEILFENVCIPANNILLGEGRGFEIAQGRLGPGRLHHCMRLIGAADRGMQMMVQRALQRKAFGKVIAQQGSFLSDVARCRIDLEKTRLLVLEAADQLDRLGNKKARGTIAMAKVAAPDMALKVLDTAMQVHGAAGLSGDTVLAHLWATARTLRIADGPDEVHLGTIAKMELQRARL